MSDHLNEEKQSQTSSLESLGSVTPEFQTANVQSNAETSQLMSLQNAANSSPQVSQLKSLQSMSNSGGSNEPVQKKENNTGLPTQLKEGMENISGQSLDDVNVHYNSEKPAQMNALAYAQGSDIHVGPGQEKHLAHEAAHVVQQKEGRVKPTTQMKGTNVNDDPGLEKEADVMGANALKAGADSTVQKKSASTDNSNASVQMKTTNVTLPENLGPTQDGPIATKGEGDKNAFSPNDVNQGSIGDCYFLASLIAVANTNPGLLEKAITDNKNGTFTVRLYQEKETGMWWWKKKKLEPVNVIIYPTFPVSVNGNDSANANASTLPAHAHGGDQDAKGKTEIWVRLIEKAYALMAGSYAKIGNGGLGADALEALTGKQYKEKVLSKNYKKRIIEMVEAGYPVEVGTSAAKFQNLTPALATFAQNNSIVAGHAYAVMSADSSKIKVRNPWGVNARNAEPEMTWAQFDKLFNQFSDREE